MWPFRTGPKSLTSCLTSKSDLILCLSAFVIVNIKAEEVFRGSCWNPAGRKWCTDSSCPECYVTRVTQQSRSYLNASFYLYVCVCAPFKVDLFKIAHANSSDPSFPPLRLCRLPGRRAPSAWPDTISRALRSRTCPLKKGMCWPSSSSQRSVGCKRTFS